MNTMTAKTMNKTYYRDISKFGEIPPQDLNAIVEKHLNGDKEASDKIICSYVRMVPKIAQRFIGLGVDYDDLISEGNLAIVKAIKSIKKEKITLLSVYVHNAIRNRMLNTINSQDGVISVPKGFKLRRHQIHQEEEKFLSEYHRMPTDEEMAKILQTQKHHLQIYKNLKKYIYLDQNDQFGVSTHESIEDTHNAPLKNITEPESEQYIEDILKCLDEREKIIAIKHLGLDGSSPQTFQEIAISLNLTRARIFQIYNLAMIKIRRRYKEISKA